MNDFTEYLTLPYDDLVMELATVSHLVFNLEVEIGDLRAQERQTKANSWAEATNTGASTTAADRYASNAAVPVTTELLKQEGVLNARRLEYEFIMFLLTGRLNVINANNPASQPRPIQSTS